MNRLAWVLLACPMVVTAAPVPKETDEEKIEKAFGTIEDPEKDCEFKLDDGKLKITMKGGKQYDWDDEGKVKNCPRIVREVKGDFVATVKAYAELPEKAKLADNVTSKWMEVGAGLIIARTEKLAWRAGVHDLRGDKRGPTIMTPTSFGPAGIPIDKIGDGPWVRLTRKGDQLSTAVSGDGKKWLGVLSFKCDADDAVRVGVYGVSNISEDVTVTLSEFSVEQPKDEKKEDKKGK